MFNTDASHGNNGYFSIKQKYTKKPVLFFIQASDGSGWEHVSVSMPLGNRTPTWEEMCFIKDLFWDAEDVVVQYHPAKKDYVNLAKDCLHLWRPTKEEIPTPPSIFVGFKNLNK
jgi:hypothetical protein